jgi:OOP family OmpA-OmpF porin
LNRNFWVLLSATYAGLMFFDVNYAAPGNASEWTVERIIRSVNLGAARGICVGTVKECLAKLESSKDKNSGKTEMIVTFEHDSAQLSQEARITLQQIAHALNKPRLSHTKIVVKGYTDATGPAEYNLILSEKRARSVRDFLLVNGLIKERVSTIGIGEISPRVADEFDPANRRVEIRISIQ